MKKIITILTAIIICFSIVACSVATGENNGDENGVNEPIEYTLSQEIEIAKIDVDIDVQQKTQRFLSDFNYESQSKTAIIYQSWMRRAVESFKRKLDAAKSKEELSELKTQVNRYVSDSQAIIRLNLSDGVRRFNVVYTSDAEGREYSIALDRGVTQSSGGVGNLTASGFADGTAFKVVANGYEINASSTLADDLPECGDGYAIITKEEHKVYLGASKTDDVEGVYVGVIAICHGQIVGYTAFESDFSQGKSVNFDLAGGQEVTEEQVIELMKLAYKGTLEEQELKELPNKKSLPVYDNGKSGVEPENWRYSSDCPTLYFEAEQGSADTEYEVWSEMAFTYNGEEVKSATVKGGERVYYSDVTGAESAVYAIKYVDGEIVGVSVAKVTTSELGNGLLYHATPINVSISINADRFNSITSVPKELALAYIDYFAGQDVPEIRVYKGYVTTSG